ncbi:MAG: pyruvate kinase [Ruminococcaceae bacterium]|nr:pyruvate kinase [Oscillospiraceae bacterium]
MRKTKIVCTIGPASRNEKILKEMITSGMNVARLNFSHGSHEYHLETIELIKKVRSEMGVPLAIMLDTKGPEIRIKSFKNSVAKLEEGNLFTLYADERDGDENGVSVTYPSLASYIRGGETLLVDDGNIRLEALKPEGDDIVCRVITGGELSDKKGINIPCVNIDMPYLSERDKEDIRFGIENDVDFIAASFVRSAEDVKALRKFKDYHGGHDIRIISKIENMQGVENFDEILKNSDGIMVARGDMGVEVSFEKLPGLQKRFINRCYQAGKMAICATQMLESMISHPNPTRAEITDVANAVFDGTSAVMLSGETAMGNYPVLTVQVMARIAEQAESDAFEMGYYSGKKYDMDTDTTNAMCDAACTTARDINAKAIIALTKCGHTARRMSKFRPFEPIVAATPLEKTFHQLSLSWGVYPVVARYQQDSESLFRHAIDCAKQIDLVENGDIVVIAAGVPLDTTGSTNLLKVSVVGAKY